MAAICCGFRRHQSSPNRSSNQTDSENEQKCGMKFMKQRSLWGAMKIRKTSQDHILKQEAVYKNDIKSKILTLEDWIISSPDQSGGEIMHAHKPSSSRKIHPSFNGADLMRELDQFVPKSASSGDQSLDISLMKLDEAENINRSKSGKMKKKVSFRSPEVADIYVLEPSGGIVHQVNGHSNILYKA